MGIRVQPQEIDVPPGNPFAYDLLGREEHVQVLTNMIANLEGPCAMALDAAWGAGKTTFLRMWGQYLLDEDFPVVQFNAWETDFTGEPFVALASEVSEGLKDWRGDSVKPAIEKMTKAAKSAARWVVPGVIRMAASTIPIAGGEIGQAAGALAAQLLDEYPEARQTVHQFRTDLQAMADALWENHDQKPLVILIDELDRCRPSYAIELLETSKHVFSINHAVFILAVNRSQLAHSVKVLYGSQFDAEGYLRRFFDHEIVLPSPDRGMFIEEMLRSLGIGEALSQADQRWRLDHAPSTASILTRFLERSDLDLRTMAQTIHRLGLVLSSLSGKQSSGFRLLIVLTILKAVDPPLFRGFADGDMTDDEITLALLIRPEFRELENENAGELVESVIIAALSDGNDVYQPTSAMENKAPLLWRHHNSVRNSRGAGGSDRSARILSMVTDLYEIRTRGGESQGLHEAVRLIEFVSLNSTGNRT